jgi:hypothetical protein
MTDGHDPGPNQRPDTPRRVDFRTLPSIVQWAIALLVVALVACLAWLVGRDDPVPGWISKEVIPAIAAVYLALGGWWLVRRVLRRK